MPRWLIRRWASSPGSSTSSASGRIPREALPHDVVGIDRLLTNVMLYWLTDTASSSAYVGYMQESSWGAAKSASGIPTAVIVFAHDVGIRRYAEPEHAITRWTDVEDRGGHFAALEEPETLTAVGIPDADLAAPQDDSCM